MGSKVSVKGSGGNGQWGGTVGIDFGIGKAKISVGSDKIGIGGEVNVGIGQIGGEVSNTGASANIGINIGAASTNVGIGTDSASGFTDFGISIAGLSVNISQQGCTITVEKKIWGQTIELYSYTDPKCKQPTIPTPSPSPATPSPSPATPSPTRKQCSDGDWYLVSAMNYGFYLADEVLAADDAYSNRPAALAFERQYADQRCGVNNWEIRPIQGEVIGGLACYFTFSKTPPPFMTARASGLPGIEIYTVVQYKQTGGGRLYYKGGNTILAGSLDENCLYKRTLIEPNFPPCPPPSSTPTTITPPPWNPPPMTQDKCCSETASMLRKIMKALDVERLEKEGFTMNNRLMVAGGGGVSTARTYAEIMQFIIRMMAHGMIFEPNVKIADASSTKAGKQELELKFVNASAWAQGITEMVYEVMDDGNASTATEIKLAIQSTQQHLAIVDCVRKLDAVLDALGVQMKQKREMVQTQFDLTLGEKGFDESGEVKSFDFTDDKETEAMLPAMLTPRSNPLKTVGVHPKADTILELLEEIQKSLQNKGVTESG